MATQPIRKLDDDILPGKRHPGRRMTEAQFENWIDEDTRAEWVDGEVVMMSPANYDHSDVAAFLNFLLRYVVERKKLGVVQGPEYTVRLGQLRRRRVPDVVFVSKGRMSQLRPTYIEGAPDLIMEVVSPDSNSRDWREKYFEYRDSRVREYWIISPMHQHVEAYTLKGTEYVQIPERRGKLTSKVVKDFWIKTDWLWMRPLPTMEFALRALGAIK